MTEQEGARIIVEGLTGENSLDVQIRCLNQGLDRDLLDAVVEAGRFLIVEWAGRTTVPKRLAASFINIGSQLDCRFYPEQQQAEFRSAGRELVRLAHDLFDPHGQAVMLVGDELRARGDDRLGSRSTSIAVERGSGTIEAEAAAVDVLFERLVGQCGIPVKLRLHQGLDRESLEEVVGAIRYLTQCWKDRADVPRRMGIVFADLWRLWHLGWDAYGDEEQDAMDSGCMRLQELAEGLLTSEA